MVFSTASVVSEERGQPLKCRMIGAMASYRDDIDELFRLLDYLRQANVFVNQQPDAALPAIADRQAKNAFDVVGAP